MRIDGAGTTGNVVEGNYIGTTASGTGVLANGGDGVNVSGGASGNIIGGTATLLVANNGGGTVGSYSGGTGALLSGLTGNATDHPFNLAYGPDGNLYVSYQFAAEVLRYNGVTGAFMDTFIPSGSGGLNFPVSMVFSGNYLLVASRSTSQILRYDATTGAFVDAFIAVSVPNAMTLAPDGSLYVASDGSQAILHYDSATGALLGQFAVQGETDAMAFAADGTLYVTNQNANSIDHFDPASGAFLGTLASGGRLDALSDLHINADGTFDVLNYGSSTIVRLSSTGEDLGVIVPASSGLNHPTHFLVSEPARNVISGNALAGVRIDGAGTTGNVVAGNYIGTDKTGLAALANTLGISIGGGATNNTIGGTSTGTRNVISGNTDDGIDISGSGTTGNVVENNFIGLDVTGETILGNTATGVVVTNGASGNFIGDITGSSFNVISGNGTSGVEIRGVGTSNNQVVSNLIGLDANGATAKGNLGSGVKVDSGASNNIIGGVTAANRNVISGNAR